MLNTEGNYASRIKLSKEHIAKAIDLNNQDLLELVAQTIATSAVFTPENSATLLAEAVDELEKRFSLKNKKILETILKLSLLINALSPTPEANPIKRLAAKLGIERNNAAVRVITHNKRSHAIGHQIWEEITQKDLLTETEQQAIRAGDMTPFLPLTAYDLNNLTELTCALGKVKSSANHPDNQDMTNFWCKSDNKAQA